MWCVLADRRERRQSRIQAQYGGCQEHLRRQKRRDLKRQKGALISSETSRVSNFQEDGSVLKCHFLKNSLCVAITMNLLKGEKLPAEFYVSGKTKNMTNNRPDSRGFC